MPGSGIARVLMTKQGVGTKAFKGNYNKKVTGRVSKNVHNQPKSHKGSGHK